MDTYVIVTSVIFFQEKEFNYSKIRSVFSPEERLIQTHETLDSIRRYLPGTKIILVEGGTKDIKNEFSEQIHYIYIGNRSISAKAINGRLKGLGEMFLMMHALLYLRKKQPSFIYKISGRYKIDDNFNLVKWNNAKFNFKIYGNTYSTRFYGFSSNFILPLLWYFIKSVGYILRGQSIEECLFKSVPKSQVNILTTLGVEGVVGNYGNTIKE